MTGFGKRVAFAFRSFFSILLHGDIAADILRELGITPGRSAQASPAAPSISAARPPADSCDRAVQMLALLQRDGRLIDFLAEEVSQYPDAQLGAAVRVIHDSCRQALDRYIKLEPVLASEEDQPVTVPAGFDPAAIKLIGNVMGTPPMRGLLRHRGWRIQQVSLPALPEGSGRSIVAPAEVEIS
jgi:uncharacterized protein DUF2760